MNNGALHDGHFPFCEGATSAADCAGRVEFGAEVEVVQIEESAAYLVQSQWLDPDARPAQNPTDQDAIHGCFLGENRVQWPSHDEGATGSAIALLALFGADPDYAAQGWSFTHTGAFNPTSPDNYEDRNPFCGPEPCPDYRNMPARQRTVAEALDDAIRCALRSQIDGSDGIGGAWPQGPGWQTERNKFPTGQGSGSRRGRARPVTTACPLPTGHALPVRAGLSGRGNFGLHPASGRWVLGGLQIGGARWRPGLL